MAGDIFATLLSCPKRVQRCRWTPGAGGGNGSARGTLDRLDVTSLSGPAGTFAALTTPPLARELSVPAVKVEVHSSNSSSGAGSDENLSSSSSDRGSDPGTAAGENDYEDIYEVRHRANEVNVVNHVMQTRGKESKSPSRDSGSHSRSGSMSSTGSGSGAGGGGGVVVCSGTSSVVVLHATGAGAQPVNSSKTAVTNVTVDGPAMVTDTSDMLECYETIGEMTPGTLLFDICIFGFA